MPFNFKDITKMKPTPVEVYVGHKGYTPPHAPSLRHTDKFHAQTLKINVSLLNYFNLFLFPPRSL